MTVARRWGCTPAQLRECTLAELRQMVDVLKAEDEARAELEAELEEQRAADRLAEHYPEMGEPE